MNRGLRTALAASGLAAVLACDPFAPLGVLSDQQKLDRITLAPDSSDVRVGDSVQVVVTLVGKGGGTLSSGSPTISVGNPLVIAITTGGWVRGVAIGRSEVLATLSGKRGAAVVRVVP